MKEYDENEAVALMSKTLVPEKRNENAVCEVLDLIYDYYDENGDLDFNLDSDDDVDLDAMVSYIARYLRKNSPEVEFSDEEIAAMVKAEIEYEESLL